MKKNLFTNYYLLITNSKKWIVKNRVEFLLLVAILFLGGFFRLFRISEYMMFLGDEGRDAIIVRRFLVDFDLILVGPGTSIGNMYLGPLYYYLMAPFLLFFNFSPVGPAVMVALLGIMTIFLVWYVTRKWFYKGPSIAHGAMIAAFLYAISPTVITYSRSSWNPNIMPFFALLTIYSVWNFWYDRQHKWLMVTGVSMAFALQSHYLGLLLVPTIGLFWLMRLIREAKTIGNNTKFLKSKFLRYSLQAIFIFTLLMSPLVIFDARHGWRNYEAMKVFFTQRQTTVSVLPWKALPKIQPIREEFLERVFTGFNQGFAQIISYVVLVFMIYFLSKYFIFKKGYKRLFKGSLNSTYSAYLLITIWIFTAMVGFGLYKQEIYDHYFGIIYAVPFIVFGGMVEYFKNKKAIFYLLIAVFVVISINDLKENPLKYPPNRQLQRSQAVSKKIIEEADGEKFNIAVIAERNYEGAYQYFLERREALIVMIDPLKADDTITDQLFVVCEYENQQKCDPTHNPKAEVANFGWSKIEDEWEVAGVTLYKLTHSE